MSTSELRLVSPPSPRRRRTYCPNSTRSSRLIFRSLITNSSFSAGVLLRLLFDDDDDSSRPEETIPQLAEQIETTVSPMLCVASAAMIRATVAQRKRSNDTVAENDDDNLAIANSTEEIEREAKKTCVRLRLENQKERKEEQEEERQSVTTTTERRREDL